jgi:hypothetical protein
MAANPSPAERETARRLMDEGKSRLKTGELDRALDAYKKAHEIMHVPSTGIAVAKTQYQMGHLVEAHAAAREVLQMPREDNEPAPFEHARKQARQLDDELKKRIPTVKITVRGAPAEKVLVDDVEVPLDSLKEPVPMNPGTRIISARSAEGAESKTSVALSEKDTLQIELELGPGKTVGNAPVKGTTPNRTSGPSLEGSGGERSALSSTLMYGGFGIAVVGVTVGSITGLYAMSKAGDVKPQCENKICDPAASADLDGAKSMATIANISFVAAGVGAVVGIIGLILPKKNTVHVQVGIGSAGVRGTF